MLFLFRYATAFQTIFFTGAWPRKERSELAEDSTERGTTTHGSTKPVPIASRLFGFLSSVHLAVVLLGLICVACVVGTVIPQAAPSEKSIARFGETLDGLFRQLNLYDLYHSKWFVALLTVFAANVLTCIVKRTRFRLTSFGFVATHASILLIVVGVLMGAFWGEKGRVVIKEGETAREFAIRRGGKMVARPLPFGVKLDDFILEKYDTGPGEIHVHMKGSDTVATAPVEIDAVGVDSTFTLPDDQHEMTILRYVPDFMIDLKTREVSSRSDHPNNPAVRLRVNGPKGEGLFWLFSKFPKQVIGRNPLDHATFMFRAGEGKIKDYVSKVAVIEDGVVVRKKDVIVNDPLKYRGYSFYQSSYDDKNESWTLLGVAKDPGKYLVYAGYAVMVVGMVFTFYVRPYLTGRRAG